MNNYGINRSTSNNSDDYDKKHIKIKFYSNDDSEENLNLILMTILKKTLELYNMIIVVRSVFYDGIKHYPQFFRRMFA